MVTKVWERCTTETRYFYLKGMARGIEAPTYDYSRYEHDLGLEEFVSHSLKLQKLD